MKIKVIEKSYGDVMKIDIPKHKKPLKPTLLFRTILRLLSLPEVLACRVKLNKTGMDKLGKQPALILMNHSCFLDLKIASVLFSDRPFNIVCTSDGFIGKYLLMRLLGCIPTQKFVTDGTLVRDIKYAVEKNKCSVLMYPEASYSFDGTATPLPDSIGKLVKLLSVPVVTVITDGAFLHDPLYNGLRHRRVKASAEVKYLITPEEIKELSADDINAKINREFDFDGFARQRDNKLKITEKFRAEGLERVLYKCPHCFKEGEMFSVGEKVACRECKKTYYLDEYGVLISDNAEFTHIPDWYAWERKCVREEIENGEYKLKTPVDIYIGRDYKAIYKVGSGTLTHSADGFRLTGCDGQLEYTQSPHASYGLYADYFWYEIGDMICIGDKKCLYYCFPKDKKVSVAKARLAAEEMFKLNKRVRTT